MHLVTEQLVHAIVQLRFQGLELPAEMLLEIGIGKPARHPLLEGEGVGVAELGGRGVADEGAQVVEEGLRPLPLAEGSVAPALDKLMWLHYNPTLYSADFSRRSRES